MLMRALANASCISPSKIGVLTTVAPYLLKYTKSLQIDGLWLTFFGQRAPWHLKALLHVELWCWERKAVADECYGGCRQQSLHRQLPFIARPFRRTSALSRTNHQ